MNNTLSKIFVVCASLLALNSNLLASDSDAQISSSVTTKKTVSYPVRPVDRPSILPVGVAEVGTNFELVHAYHMNASVSSKLGVLENMHVSLGYSGISLHGWKKFMPEKTINLGGKYKFLSLPFMGSSVDVSLPLHVAGGEIIQSIKIGIPTGFGFGDFAFGVGSDLLTLKKVPYFAFDVDMPFWVGYEVYGNLWVELQSSFGKIVMENKQGQANFKNSKGFWQKLPAVVAPTYAINEYVDVKGGVGFSDLINIKKSFTASLGVDVRFGNM